MLLQRCQPFILSQLFPEFTEREEAQRTGRG